MAPRVFAFSCTFLVLCLLGSALAQDKPQPVYLRIVMPDENALLFIDYQSTKQTGAKRIFVTPPLVKGKTYSYTIIAKWESAKNAETVRMRVVTVQVGKLIEVDLSKSDDKFRDLVIEDVDAPDEEVIDEMCKLAEVGKNDVVYDIGCGDGSIVLTAIGEYGAKRGVGVDNDAELLKEAVTQAKADKVFDRVTFRKQDVLTVTDVSDATVVMLSSGEQMNVLLMPMLKRTLKPGARIVSYDAAMGEWKADKKVAVTDEKKEKHTLYLWTIK